MTVVASPVHQPATQPWVLAERRQTGLRSCGVTPFEDECDPVYDDVAYYRFWTGIGPCATRDLEEASTFPSEQAAMQSPAYSFAWTFYRPELAPVAQAGNDSRARANGEQA